MGNIIDTLATLIKMLADLFKFPSLAPAMLFVTLNQLFIFPHFEFISLVKKLSERDMSDQVLVGAVIAVFLGYFINAIEIPIVKLYEGYSWKETRLGQWLIDRQRERRTALKQQDPHAVDYFFPAHDKVLPTVLGNIMAAFEAYSMNKYCIDSVVAWPRMFPILVKQEFMPYLAEHRSTLDFLLNNSLLLAAFGLECMLLRILACQGVHYILPIVAFLGSFFCYLASLTSASRFGALCRVAFDLFRYHLAKALGLRPVRSFSEEQNMWGDLRNFWQEQLGPNFDRLNHRKTGWPIDIFEQEEKTQ